MNVNLIISLLMISIALRVDTNNVTESSSLVINCGHAQFRCDNNQCIDENQVCDYYPDCSDGSDESECGWCDFSTGQLCGWNKSDKAKYSCDSRGYPGKCFLSQENCDYKPQGYNFTLTSPVLRETSKNCQVSFAYFTYDSNNFNTKDVYVQRMFNNYKIDIAHIKLDNDKNRIGTFDIGYIAPQPESRLLFNFIQNTFACGVLGIGNVTFNNCKPKTIANCSKGLFGCDNGQCISERDVCDNYPDCSDGSDESECGWCDFSTGGLCGWHKSDQAKYSCDNRGYPGKCFIGQENCAYKPQGYNFTLTSPVLRKTSKNCQVSFAYFTYDSNNFDTKDVYVQRMFNNYKIKIANFKLDYQKNLIRTFDIGYIAPQPESRLLFNFIQNTFACGVLGIGNVTFNNCVPKTIPIDCDFDYNANCTWWFIGKRHDGNWKWNSAGYIYQEKNNLAEIRSPLIEPSVDGKGACLSFKYLINGTKNSLILSSIKLNTKDQDETVIWSAKNSINDNWKSVELFINNSVDIDIGFIAKSNNGITAIDNIALKPGLCHDIPTISELSCTFENIAQRESLCNFEKVQSSCIIQADVVSSRRGYFGKGPKTDHTLSNKDGWLLNINQNQSSRCNNQSTHGIQEIRFVYPKTQGISSPSCLYFWYQLSSYQVTLGVYLGQNQSNEMRLWHMSGEGSKVKWNLAAVRLDAPNNYDIVFSVKFQDYNIDSFAAIDDIMIEHGDECNKFLLNEIE